MHACVRVSVLYCSNIPILCVIMQQTIGDAIPSTIQFNTSIDNKRATVTVDQLHLDTSKVSWDVGLFA